VNLSLVKTATDERADRLLAREARWLRSLEEVRDLAGQVPRLIEEGTAPGGRRYLVMSIAPVRGETRAFTPGHARFLASLGKARFRTTDFELSGCAQEISRALEEAEDYASEKPLSILQEAYRECETALLYWTGPYVLAQGDFAPWNVRSTGEQLFVFDWSQARAEASPLDDVLHYLTAQRVLSRRPLTAAKLRAAMKSAREFALAAYPGWSWRGRVIGVLTLVYLIGAALRGGAAVRSMDERDPLVGAYLKLIETRSAWMPA
jgi:hypothetical protein